MSKFPELQGATQWIALVGRGCLPARTIYVLSDEELPAEFAEKAPEGAIAWTSDILDLQLADVLQLRNAYRGPGFATVVMTSRIKALGLPLDDNVATGLAGHEFAHWCEHQAYLRSNERQRHDALLRGFGDRAGKAEWCMHGPGFVRACVHIFRRLQRVGWQGSMEYLAFAGQRYSMTHKSRYWQAAMREAELFDDEPLVHTLCRPVPEDFRELWYQDLESSVLAIIEREEAAA